MNENHLLYMLANPKKIKKDCTNQQSESNSDSDTENYTDKESNPVNQYNFNTNPLCETEDSNKINYSPELKLLLENLDNIDNYILNNTYNEDFEIIQNYLIDLLFLIKSKK